MNMKKFKNIIALSLSGILTTAAFAGCGSSPEPSAAPAPAEETTAPEAVPEAEAPEASAEAETPNESSEGSVLNIYCWNEEFKSRVTDHYPGYEAVDGTTGKIGDVTVRWQITPNDDNAYQNNLDETLLKQENAAADELKAAGYSIMSSVNDSYRVYSNNVTSKWVIDGKINIDENLMNWVEDSKALFDKGQTSSAELWSDDWSKGFYPEGKVFCYFGPAWFINFSMAADQEGSIGNMGGWGITEGPQGFYWGGTWICAAAGTDNPTLVKDIMLKLTTDETIMKEIVIDDDDFVNNKPAMEAMAADTSYSSKILGGTNPLAMYCAGAESIDLSNLSGYDQGCNEEFQNAMKNYFEGNATLDEALNLFYTAVIEKYPELTY
ncbi:MAG: hypothetical protein HFI04_01920 [Lachnospiraceae bacterium]|jgi:hypothetical protein|nr:hypothetical protein [Lachnospiraceae bacterium]